MRCETKPRRKPKRRSGEQIVTSILDAAELLLVEVGFPKLTTNAIAERAGVSVGSVYQYFPNKQAIVAGITRRLNEGIVRRVREGLEREAPLPERVHAVVDAICSRSEGDAELRRALLLHVPRSWEHTGMDTAEDQLARMIAKALPELTPNRTEEELSDLKFALIFAVRGAAQGALLHRPEMLDDGRLTRILSHLILSLRAPPAVRSTT